MKLAIEEPLYLQGRSVRGGVSSAGGELELLLRLIGNDGRGGREDGGDGGDGAADGQDDGFFIHGVKGPAQGAHFGVERGAAGAGGLAGGTFEESDFSAAVADRLSRGNSGAGGYPAAPLQQRKGGLGADVRRVPSLAAAVFVVIGQAGKAVSDLMDGDLWSAGIRGGHGDVTACTAVFGVIHHHDHDVILGHMLIE